jgi:hypothetical protein
MHGERGERAGAESEREGLREHATMARRVTKERGGKERECQTHGFSAIGSPVSASRKQRLPHFLKF